MDDLIRFDCPACGKSLKARREQAGKRVKCPSRDCAQVIPVPLPPAPNPNRPPRILWPWFAGGGVVTVLFLGLLLWYLTGGTNPPSLGPSTGSEVDGVSTPPAKPIAEAAGGPKKPIAKEPGKQPDNTVGKEREIPIGEIRQLKGLSALATGVAISPDGSRALSCSGEMEIVETLEQGGGTTRYFVGTLAAREPDTVVRIWDLENGKEVGRLQGHTAGVQCVVFSADGRRALSGGKDGTLRLWDMDSTNEIGCLKGHEGTVTSVALSTDGRRALSGGADKTLRMWDVEAGKELLRFKGHEEKVTCVALSGDGKRALSGSKDKTVRVWDAATAKELFCLKGHEEAVWSVALSPDRRKALSGSGNGGPFGSKDNSIRLWDIETGKEIRQFITHKAWVRSVAFSPDGSRALSAADDGIVRLWEVQSAKQLQAFEGHKNSVNCVTFSFDGRRALSGGRDQTVRLWGLPKVEPSTLQSVPKKLANQDSPPISDLKILSTKLQPPGVTFSLRIQPGKVPISTGQEDLWICLGDPSRLKWLSEQWARKPWKQRGNIHGFGNIYQGWETKRCSIKRATNDPLVWTCEVEFPDKELLKTTPPVSFLLFDDEGNASNQIDVVVDFKFGKLLAKGESEKDKAAGAARLGHANDGLAFLHLDREIPNRLRKAVAAGKEPDIPSLASSLDLQ